MTAVAPVSSVRTAFRELRGNLSWPILVVLLVSTVFNLIAFSQLDVAHTAGSSYAFYFGHFLDFYTYNATVQVHDPQYDFIANDYFPSIYIVFAIWMLPVKMLVSPGLQAGWDLSPVEIVWARILIVLVFYVTCYLVWRITQMLWPDAAKTRTRATVVAMYLLSPVAVFAFNLQGQYDDIGMAFTLLGFYYWLKGDKWKFAMFFAVAGTFKYFALLIFLPLLVLKFKRWRDIIPLGLISVAGVVVEAGVYLDNPPFREHTLFSLAGSKFEATLGGDGFPSSVGIILSIIGLALLMVFLWRWVPPNAELENQVAVHAAVLGVAILFVGIAFHPQWLYLLTPFAALAFGYIRRKSLYLVVESVAFIGFIWWVVNSFPQNLDAEMLSLGGLKDLIESNGAQLRGIYKPWHLALVGAIIMLYGWLFLPAVFAAFERFLDRGRAFVDAPVAGWAWWVRLLTVPVLWTIPVLFLVFIWVPLRQ